MKLITDGAALVKFIDETCAQHKALEGKIHVAACSALYHANEHRNADMMQRLIAGLGGSVRRNALIAWCQDFGKLTVNEKGDNVQFDEKAEAGETPEACAARWAAQQTLAQAKPFWDYKPEAKFQAFDLGAQIQALIKKAEKAANDERNNVPTKELLALRSIALNIDPMVGVA